MKQITIFTDNSKLPEESLLLRRSSKFFSIFIFCLRGYSYDFTKFSLNLLKNQLQIIIINKL